MPEFWILIAFMFTPDGQFDFVSVPVASHKECAAALEHLEDVAALSFPGVDFRGSCVASNRIGPSLY